MNKTYLEILAELLSAKESDPNLSTLDSDSKTSLWRRFLEVCAWAIYNFQLSAMLHLQEVQELIAAQKVFNLKRYRTESLRFQFGFDLLEDSDQFSSTYMQNGIPIEATGEQIEASKIIKYAACNRVISQGKVRIVIKIAPENLEEIFPDEVMTAFGRYIEEIAPAGDHVTFVNYLPDMLRFAFKIKYDPMVLRENGMNIITAKYPVNDAINNFLKNLPFNGELSVQKLESAILAVDGVEDLQTLSIETKWIDPAVNGYGLYQPVNMSVIPQSGRFKVEDFTGLQYIV
ncbi:hypothetical protein [Chryseobacterium sp. CCH4-E10]|jgi:hypothetical protein|uniref:hypothetical protein n=1 Tax=Chryseobacterium sp. CCH4-E10 TaxID=1768758 RepID=UPI00082A57CC|nr:hypothetical protein [Chryseobacterium sp. CCH4-E10]